MISPQQDPRRAMRELVRAGATREFIATGTIINDYLPTEIEWRWCQDRIEELAFMAKALGSTDMLRLQLKIHNTRVDQ